MIRRLFAKTLALAAALMLGAGPAMAGTVPFITAPIDSFQNALNTAIQSVNTNVAPLGAGAMNTALTVNATASAVNGLAITPGATGSAVQLTAAGGPNPDTNTGIFIAGNGTGAIYLGGTTTTLAGLQVAQTAARVNDVIVTPTATGSVPTVISGGAGADANIGMLVGTVGTGSLSLGGPTVALAPLKATPVASGVNQVVVTGAATGSAAAITETGDANRNLSVAGAGTGLVILGQAICTVTGSTPQTCNGQRGIVTTGTLVTAAVTNAAYVINNSSVTTSSLVECTDQGYSGTLVTNGEPVIETCVPGTGTITVNITNVHASNALNGTVQIGFTVLN